MIISVPQSGNNGKFEMSNTVFLNKRETETGSQSTEGLNVVDFKHPEFCSGCDPITCIVEGNDFSGGNWRDVLVAMTEGFLRNKPKAAELYCMNLSSNSECSFLMKDKPKLSSRQLSNGYWINVNLSIKDLVITIGRLCEFCDVDLNDVYITYIPKQRAGKMRSVTKSKDDAIRFAQMNSETVSVPSIPDTVVEVLNKNYASGFRFDTTYINLLSNASGVDIDRQMQLTLKRMMFRRDDDIFFMLNIVADAATRKDIIDFADRCLEEYGCFEMLALYKRYEDKVNPNCIRNADDFQSFYEQIGKSGVRCVQAPYIGNRIARYSNGVVWTIFKEVAAKIITVITDEYYGSCNEDDLQTKFCAFSTDLLGKIIKQCAAEELIRVKINDSICYQTFEALGLPEDFSEVLVEVLGRLDDIGLEAAQNILHTAISLSLGVNFMVEFNLPDWETFRRIITAFYKAEPHREWKSNIFLEVTA